MERAGLMPWEPSIFPSGVSETIELGRQLSIILHCPVRLVSWVKPQYECYHNVVFAKFIVEGAIKAGDVQPLVDMHKKAIMGESNSVVAPEF
jgi:hypothetical protein